MYKIAICGRKQHGKGAVADAMHAKLGQHVLRRAIAEPIKRGVCTAIRQTYDIPHAIEKSDEFRAICWAVSNYIMAQDVNWLIDYALRDVSIITKGAVIIDDLRRPFEAEYLHDLDFTIVRVVRPSIPPDDPTEDMVDAIDPDYEIINDGTLDDLKAKALEVLEQIQGDEIWEDGS